MTDLSRVVDNPAVWAPVDQIAEMPDMELTFPRPSAAGD